MRISKSWFASSSLISPPVRPIASPSTESSNSGLTGQAQLIQGASQLGKLGRSLERQTPCLERLPTLDICHTLHPAEVYFLATTSAGPPPPSTSALPRRGIGSGCARLVGGTHNLLSLVSQLNPLYAFRKPPSRRNFLSTARQHRLINLIY